MNHWLERFFALQAHNTSIKQEVLAGLTTFSTMAYIIVVNPAILAQTGMDFGAVMIATILAAALSTILMGLYAGFPFALAPGMGLNAYFAYTLVIKQGVAWQVALGATFWAGTLFLLLNVLGVRSLILRALPSSLRAGLTGGIGLFLAFIGLQNIHLVVPDPSTIVTLGNVQTPEVLYAAFGLIIATALFSRGVPGAVFISIVVTWLAALLMGHAQWVGFISLPPSVLPTIGQLDLWGALQPETLPFVLALTFIALFDAAGTVTSLGELGNYFTHSGHLPNVKRIFFVDAVGTMTGGVVGTSPMTTYLESAAGMTAGGRTGLTAVTVAILFFLFLFFSPVAQSIPLFATAPALLLIGAQMLAPLLRLPLDDPAELMGTFIVVLCIPLTFSIATGLALALIVYPAIKLLAGRAKEVHWLLWILALLSCLKLAFTPS